MWGSPESTLNTKTCLRCTHLHCHSQTSVTRWEYSRYGAALAVAGRVRCGPAGPGLSPSQPRRQPESAAPPGPSARSHPAPGPPPGSPTVTGSWSASDAAHACPAPATGGAGRWRRSEYTTPLATTQDMGGDCGVTYSYNVTLF